MRKPVQVKEEDADVLTEIQTKLDVLLVVGWMDPIHRHCTCTHSWYDRTSAFMSTAGAWYRLNRIGNTFGLFSLIGS